MLLLYYCQKNSTIKDEASNVKKKDKRKPTLCGQMKRATLYVKSAHIKK